MAHSSMVKRQTIKAGFKASNVSGIFVHGNLRVNYITRAPSTRGPERHEKKGLFVSLNYDQTEKFALWFINERSDVIRNLETNIMLFLQRTIKNVEMF